MKKIILTASNSFQMTPPVIGVLKGLDIPLFHTKRNLPHPEILISSKWSSLVSLIENFLSLYAEYDCLVRKKAPRPPYSLPKEVSPSLADVMRAYKLIIYEADELIEKLHSKLKLCLLPENRTFEWGSSLKKWRDHPSAVCNKLKHNHNLLLPVSAHYSFGIVRGYGVCHYVDDRLVPNSDIHPKNFPFSFGADLRRILAHIYLCADFSVSQIKRVFPDNIDMFCVASVGEREALFFERVSSFMPLTFHHYKHKADIPLFKYKNGELIVSDQGGDIIPTGNGVITTVASGDGRTRTFPIF